MAVRPKTPPIIGRPSNAGANPGGAVGGAIGSLTGDAVSTPKVVVGRATSNSKARGKVVSRQPNATTGPITSPRDSRVNAVSAPAQIDGPITSPRQATQVTAAVTGVERVDQPRATGRPGPPNVTVGRATGRSEAQATTGQSPQVVPVAGRAVNVIQFGSAVAQRGPSAPTLVITELTGLERKISLTGRALPYKGSIKFSSEMELDEARYVGFPRTTQTVLGAKENETRMNGMWKDRFLDDPAQASVSRAFSSPGDAGAIEINDTALRTGKELCELFESMVYSGSVLRVQWLHIRRLGRLTLFEQDWWNEHDVMFAMTWKWIGLDEQIGTPSPARTSLSGLSAAFNSSYAELHEATNFDDLDGIDPTFADSVDIAVGQIQAAVLDVSDSLDSRVAAVTDTVDAVRRSASIATFVKDRAQELIDSIDSFVAPAMLVTPIATPSESQLPTVVGFSGSTSGMLTDSLTGVDAGKAIAAGCQSRAAVRMARQMRHTAARQRLAALKALDADVISTTIARSGSDLRDIARQFYGRPDDWERIRKFNGFCGSEVPAGTIVLVPTARGPT